MKRSGRSQSTSFRDKVIGVGTLLFLVASAVQVCQPVAVNEDS